LCVDQRDGWEGGILGGLGGRDRDDRNPGFDGHIQQSCQTLRCHNRIVAIAVVVPRIVGVIR